MMNRQQKNWKILAAAVILALGTMTLPQAVHASTAVSGVGTDSTYNTQGATANGTGGTAVGDNATAGGVNSTAVGDYANANSNSATAIGKSATATGEYSIASGAYSMANVSYSVAIGSQAVAGISALKTGTVTNAVAIGANATASESNTVSFGHKSTDWTGKYVDTNNANNTSYTQKENYVEQTYGSDQFSRLVNIAYGSDNHDAAAVGQVAKTAQTVTLSEDKREDIQVTTDGTTSTVSVKKNTIVSNDGTVLATFTASTAATVLASKDRGDDGAKNDYGFVSGNVLYDYTAPVAYGETNATIGVTGNLNYVSASSSVGTNLGILDSKIGTITTSNIVSQDNTISKNLELLATAISGVGDCVIDKGTVSSVSDTNYWLSTDFGNSSNVSHGANSTAYGYLANAQGDNSSAYGYSAVAYGNNSVAFGVNAETGFTMNSNRYQGTSAVAIGDTAKAMAQKSIAIGVNAATGFHYDNVWFSGGQYAVAIGDTAKAMAEKAVAIGANAEAGKKKGDGTIGVSTVAIGNTAMAYGNDSVAIGKNAYINYTATSSISIGQNAYIDYVVDSSIAIGTGAVASASNSIAIGTGAVASESNTVSFGHKKDDYDRSGNKYTSNSFARLVNVADGVSDTDAATVGQMNDAISGAKYTVEVATESKNALTVTEDTTNKKWTIKANTGAVNDGVGTLVTGGQVYSYVTGLTGGVISGSDENRTKLVSGETVYNYLHQEEVAIGNGSDAVGNYSISIGDSSTGINAGQGIAIGRNAYVGATNAVAIGGNGNAWSGAFASGESAVAIGDASRSYGKGSVALGLSSVAGTDTTQSNDVYATAIGCGTRALGIFSTAVGANNIARGDYSVAIGTANSVHGNSVTDETSNQTTISGYNTAVGIWNNVYGEGSGAFGYLNTVGDEATKYDYSYAVGYKNAVSNSRNVVFGTENTISGSATIAIGKKINTSAQNAIVIGGGTDSEITAVADNSVVLGYGSTSEKENTVSVGSATLQRKIVHVANGEADTDAATVGQLNAAVSGAQYTVAVADESKAALTVEKDDTAKTWTIKANTGAVNDGVGTLVTGGQVYSYVTGLTGGIIGDSKTTNSDKLVTGQTVYDYLHQETVAIGGITTATESHSTAVGYYSNALGVSSTALGYYTFAVGKGSVALGLYSFAGANDVNAGDDFYATALGYSSDAEALYSISIGDSYVAKDAGQGIAIGRSAQALAANGVAIGYEAVAGDSRTDDEKKPEATTRIQTVSFGHKNGDTYYGDYGNENKYSTTVLSRLTNVADGISNTDAATVGQLKSTVSGAQYSVVSGSTDALTVSQNDDAKTWTITANTANVSSSSNALVTGAQVASYVTGLISTEDISATNGKLVKGSQVYNYVNNLIGGEVATSGGNSGKLVTGAAVASAINEAKNAVAADTAKLIKVDNGAIVIGSDASGATEVSVGGRKITGLTDGKANTDAATVGQMNSAISAATSTLNSAIGNLNTAIGEALTENGNVITADNSIIGNLSALDTKIGKIPVKTEGTYNKIDASKSISENLVAIDSALAGTGVDVSHLKEITRSDGAEATGTNSLALGNNAKAQNENAIAFGTGSTVTGANSIAIGTGHTISGSNSGAFGDPDVVKGDNSFVVGNDNEVSGNNVFVLGNKVKTTVSDAVILGNESTATEDNVVSVGSETNQRKIVNVAAGVADTDAANVGQLKDAVTGTVLGVNRALESMDSRLNKVAAGAAALAALHPEDFNPEDKWSFAVGYGHYRDANAGAFGVFYKPNADTTVSLASTIGNGNTMMSAGVSFKLGQRGAAPVRPDAQTIQKLATENASQAKKIETLEADNAQMKADNAQMKADNEKMKAQIAEILKKLELSETVQKTAAAH